MQIGGEDRHTPQVAIGGRAAQEGFVVRALLLIDGEDELLLRGVARFDDMPGSGRRIGRQPVGGGDHEGQPTRPEPAL